MYRCLYRSLCFLSLFPFISIFTSEPSLFDRFRALPSELQAKILEFCDEPLREVTLAAHNEIEMHTHLNLFTLNRTLQFSADGTLARHPDFVSLSHFDSTGFTVHSNNQWIRHEFPDNTFFNTCHDFSFDGKNHDGYSVFVCRGLRWVPYAEQSYELRLWLWNKRTKVMKFLRKHVLDEKKDGLGLFVSLHKDKNRIAYMIPSSSSSLHVVDFYADQDNNVFSNGVVNHRFDKTIHDCIHVGNDIYFGCSDGGLIRIELRRDDTMHYESIKPFYFDEVQQSVVPFTKPTWRIAVDERSMMCNGIYSVCACIAFEKNGSTVLYTIDLDEAAQPKRILLNKRGDYYGDLLYYNNGILATWQWDAMQKMYQDKEVLNVWQAQRGVHYFKTMLAYAYAVEKDNIKN